MSLAACDTVPRLAADDEWTTHDGYEQTEA